MRGIHIYGNGHKLLDWNSVFTAESGVNCCGDASELEVIVLRSVKLLTGQL